MLEILFAVIAVLVAILLIITLIKAIAKILVPILVIILAIYLLYKSGILGSIIDWIQNLFIFPLIVDISCFFPLFLS